MLPNFLSLIDLNLNCGVISLPIIQFLSELHPIFRGYERRGWYFVVEDGASLQLGYLLRPDLHAVDRGDGIYRVFAVHHLLPNLFLLLNMFLVLLLCDSYALRNLLLV